MSLGVALPEREVRRSFWLNVFNGALFNFAGRLIDPPVVLTWFVSHLTSSNLLIGLVTPLSQAGWLLPQAFVSARVQRMRRKMPSYAAAAGIRVAAWLLLAAAVWWVEIPAILLAAFFALYTLAWVAAGLAGLAFFEVTAKTIPAWRRGRLFATRQLTGGLLSLGAGWIVKVILTHPGLPFPRNHAILFLLYSIIIIPAMLAFISIREPPGTAVSKRIGTKEQLRRGWRFLKVDTVYRRYMLARAMLGLADIALPFYGIYAKEMLGAPDGIIGWYLTARVGSRLAFNLPWGWISDKRGNRLVMRLQSLGYGLTALLALALVVGVESLHLRGTWLPFLVVPLYFIDGAIRPAQILAGSNFLLELAPEEERPLYLGLSNTLMGIVVLTSGFGGLLVDLMGFVGLFATALVLSTAAYALATGLPEPRREGM
ncbi:MAG TPA: MFS transporter [Thermoflexia bacterium]|jgi:MFS family permease|nr:MFS transporter [Thermoflexia bacterium]